MAVVIAATTLIGGCASGTPQVSKTGLLGSSASTATPASAACKARSGAAAAPASGALFGVSLDWSVDSLAAYTERLGRAPSVAVTFAPIPLSAVDRTNVIAAAEQAGAQGSMLLLTLEPSGGLSEVTDSVISELVTVLQDVNARGVPVVVRYGHEMNGSWYAWGQQPSAYVASFRKVARAVHVGAPGSSMMWAPSYGGGYPFAGGRYQARPGSKEARTLDTDHNGALDSRDDSYAPYYPGDEAVDWVGMSLYHWGTKYPWGENEVPAKGKLVDQLRGRYHRGGVDERVVPDFYGLYGAKHGKPVAVTETAALFAPGGPGASEWAVKQGWWAQVLAPDLIASLPRLKMVNWFEWDKYEPEVDSAVSWSVTKEAGMASAFAAALPAWAVTALGRPFCGSPK